MARQRTSAFLKNLQASGLVDDTQLAEIESWTSAAGDDDRTLAQELVNRKVLTRFQAEQILAGRIQGFVIGPYTVTDRIGAGGMGQVYKAVDREMERSVALKVLPKSRRADPEAQARFMREVRAAAKLNHRNIVTAYHVGHHGAMTYLVMEYVEGTSLHERIKAKGRLEPAEAAGVAHQAALGLEHARTHGIVHRDIKPANILIDIEGVVKILDMGLARIEHPAQDADKSGTLTSAGVIMGTFDYIAPEQAKDTHKADTRADIYSLGCTLYHMLTGHVPFPGGTGTEKIIKHATEPPTDPTQLVPDLPVELAEVLAKMITKDPDDRYQTPAEVAQALAPWAGAVAAPGAVGIATGAIAATVTQQTGTVEPGTMPGTLQAPVEPTQAESTTIGGLRRIPVWAWGAAGAVVVVLIAAILFWPRAARKPVEEPQAPSEAAAVQPVAEADEGLKPVEIPPMPADARLLVVDPDKGPYKTLKEAFAAIKPDEDVVIELRTSKVLEAEGLSVKCRQFRLRAGEGFQPILRYPYESRRALNMLDVDATEAVSIRGVHFASRCATVCSVCARAPTSSVSECTFTRAMGVKLHHPSERLLIRDCFTQGACPLVRADMASGQIGVSNCAGTLMILLDFKSYCEPRRAPGRAELRLARNTFVINRHGWHVFSFSRQGSAMVVPERLAVYLAGNVFLPPVGGSIGALVGIIGPAEDTKPIPDHWRGAMRWQGRNNLIGRCDWVVRACEDTKDRGQVRTPVIRDLSEFLKAWAPGLTDTRTEPGCAPLRWTEGAPGRCRPADIERVHQALPSGVAELGADLSRIPEPPEIDASGKVVRPSRPPASTGE